MKKNLLSFIILLSSIANANEGPRWYQGSIVLASGEVLTGEISVEQEFNAMLFRNDSSFSFYSADKVSSVYFYDADEKINRRFLTVNDPSHKSFPILFEMVVNGYVKIVRRLNMINPQSNTYKYFCLQNGRLISMNKFRSDVYPSLLNAMPNLSSVIKQEGWNIGDLRDSIIIAQYYNTIVRNNPILANR